MIDYPEDMITVSVDRPFIYFIRDRETGTILFMGRVLNPLPVDESPD